MGGLRGLRGARAALLALAVALAMSAPAGGGERGGERSHERSDERTRERSDERARERGDERARERSDERASERGVAGVAGARRAATPGEAEVTARAGASAADRARAMARHRLSDARAWGPARGVVIGLFSDGEGDAYREQIEQAAAIGASHVLVVVQHAMADVRAVSVRPLPWLTPSDDRLEDALATARSLGLGVVLMPTLYLEEVGDDEWRGVIEPSSWDAWWASYRRFILEHAELSRRHGVDVFVVGSELLSTEDQRERWAELILDVRRVTPSLISYSFNWDHLEPGAIHDLLDIVGMNAYFNLADEPGADVGEMLRSIYRVQESVTRFLDEVDRPLLVTEVGYRSVAGGEIDAWDYTRELPYDGATQARCYEAVVRGWGTHPAVRGLFFYWWRGEGGEGDTTYTPRGKPAEHVLRRWLAEGTEGADASASGPSPSAMSPPPMSPASMSPSSSSPPSFALERLRDVFLHESLLADTRVISVETARSLHSRAFGEPVRLVLPDTSGGDRLVEAQTCADFARLRSRGAHGGTTHDMGREQGVAQHCFVTGLLARAAPEPLDAVGDPSLEWLESLPAKLLPFPGGITNDAGAAAQRTTRGARIADPASLAGLLDEPVLDGGVLRGRVTGTSWESLDRGAAIDCWDELTLSPIARADVTGDGYAELILAAWRSFGSSSLDSTCGRGSGRVLGGRDVHVLTRRALEEPFELLASMSEE